METQRMGHGFAAQGLLWPGDSAILLVVTDGTSYTGTVQQTVASLVRRFGQGVLVSANLPSSLLQASLKAGGVTTTGLHIIDCLSSLTGLPPTPQDGVVHVESPTLLETIALRAEQALRRMQGPRFLLLDSLSALAVYNGAATVAEFAHSLVNRLRLQNVAAALVLVDRQAREDMQDSVRPLCDGVVRL